MGDGGIRYTFEEFENELEVRFAAPASSENVSATEARRTLQQAVEEIPDSALAGLRAFRITIAS
jgi:hypothetical protein